jgi:glutaredoxin
VSQIEYLEEFVEKFPGAKTVPQIVWYDKVIGTYENFATEIENTIGGYGENVI